MSYSVKFFICYIGNPVLLACPLFCKFCDLGDFTKIMGHGYIFEQQSISSDSKNMKIKCAIINALDLKAKISGQPKFRVLR